MKLFCSACIAQHVSEPLYAVAFVAGFSLCSDHTAELWSRLP